MGSKELRKFFLQLLYQETTQTAVTTNCKLLWVRNESLFFLIPKAFWRRNIPGGNIPKWRSGSVGDTSETPKARARRRWWWIRSGQAGKARWYRDIARDRTGSPHLFLYLLYICSRSSSHLKQADSNDLDMCTLSLSETQNTQEIDAKLVYE